MTAEEGEKFAINFINFENLFKKAYITPSEGSDKSLNRLLKAEEYLLTDEATAGIEQRMKDFQMAVYGSLKDDGLDRRYKTSLVLPRNATTIKYRDQGLQLKRFYKSRPFITKILKNNKDLWKHIYDEKTPADFEFDDGFIKAYSEFIGFKLRNLRVAEEIDLADNNSYYRLLCDWIDYATSASDSAYGKGLGPLKTPFQW